MLYDAFFRYLPKFVLHGSRLPPSFENPKDKLRSCPDDLKSTDFTVSYLYQINRLPVKKNRWMTEMSGYRDFPEFPYLLMPVPTVAVFDLDEFADFWVDFVISYLVR